MMMPVSTTILVNMINGPATFIQLSTWVMSFLSFRTAFAKVQRDNESPVFDRFRETVQNHVFPQIGQVTVSVGFASTVSGSPVEILGQADQALYYAKEHGRNQVRFYDDLLASGQLQPRVNHEDMELF